MANVKSMDYDPHNPLPHRFDDQELKRLFDVQSSNMASEDYEQIDNSNKLRTWASLVVCKYSKCEDFDAIVPYLAMTYFDLYISRRNPILQVMNDIVSDVELLALCCLTLAWKMRDTNFTIPNLQQRQPDLGSLTTFEFHKVELRILKAIDWDLRVVTAFSFLPYFVPKSLTPHGFNLRTINMIIVGIQCHNKWVGIKVTKNKPSVIAASALIAATKCLYPRQYRSFFGGIMKEQIIKENHERRFVRKEISTCKAISTLVVESDVIRSESEPPRRIRAPARRWADHETVPAGESPESSMAMDFPIGWSPATGRCEKFVFFSNDRSRKAWPSGQNAEREIKRVVRKALKSAV